MNPKITVYIGDIITALNLVSNESIDCVITSPPYWKQRDYKHPKQIGQEEKYNEYINKLVEIFNQIKRKLKPTGTFFLNIGYKYKDKELLLIPELLALELQNNGWALLNKIIWYKPNAMPSSFNGRLSNVYEPVFLFVKEESKYKYYISIDDLRIPVISYEKDKEPSKLIGLYVENSLNKNANKKGEVTNIYKNNENNIIANVCWESGENTYEAVNDFNRESQIVINLECSDCGNIISKEIDIERHKSIFCKGFYKPILPPKLDFNNKEEIKSQFLFNFSNIKPKYNGKFKFNQDNRGSSPGARKSLFGEYLVLQRRYKIYQPIVSNYLRYWKEKRKINIKNIDKLFGYRDTAGHWFRKDTGKWGKGGSIPLPNDWIKLKEILKFDDVYDRWITETHLVLQTVRPHPKGKNPGDVWNIKLQPLSETHFATFPEELVKRCILAGCPENGVILDPFAGSGTTGKVAKDLERDSILIELIPEYLKIIKSRCGDIDEVKYVK